VKAREAAAREELAREVERTALGIPPPDGDDGRPGGESVQPLGRGGHARAYDLDALGVRVRTVGMDGARVALELRRDVEPRMAGGEEDVGEGAEAVELEPSLDGSDPLDPAAAEALVPP
jgi:hypothetical protein